MEELSGETVEVPIETIHAMCYICNLYGQLLEFRYRIQEINDMEEVEDKFIFNFPIVQGVREQFLMDEVGELEWDGELAGKGMKFLDENPELMEAVDCD